MHTEQNKIGLLRKIIREELQKLKPNVIDLLSGEGDKVNNTLTKYIQLLQHANDLSISPTLQKSIQDLTDVQSNLKLIIKNAIADLHSKN